MHENRWCEIIGRQQSDIYNNLTNLAEMYRDIHFFTYPPLCIEPS